MLALSVIAFTFSFGLPDALSLTHSFNQSESKAQQDGIYTEAQALRGQALYDRRCASCHGSKLEGGSASALVGSRFLAKWGQGNHTVEDLYYITRTQMPYGAAGTLSHQQYIDVVAYMLKANGYKAGASELPADSPLLKQIKIVLAGSVKENSKETGADGALKATGQEEGVLMPSSKWPSQKELNAAPSNTTDWLMSNHDYSGQRFVDLKQINRDNVASLQPACTYQDENKKAFHTNPVVYRGVTYITTPSSTIAFDAATCKERWRYDRKPKSLEIWPPNRGVAIKDGRVVRATTDGYLFALDLETGKPLWERKIVASEKNEGSFNMAPVIFENLVLIGLGISEQGIKGWIGAFKLENGEQVWRFNTVPDAEEPGAETWGNADAMLKGGGAVWGPLSLDSDAGLVYVPVANPAPDLYDDLRPGANLYTSAMIVLDARTGRLKWYYQAVPHDTHDYDLTQVSPLFTTTVAGKKRKLVSAVGKDGLLHVLDRETRKQLYEVAVTTRSNTDAPLTTEGVHVCPGMLGGVQWNGPAYNPGTNMLYVPSVDWCGTFKKAKDFRYVEGQNYLGGNFNFDNTQGHGWLTAIDASTGAIRWRYQSEKPMLAAVTTTSSGLVFAGELTGDVIALDAQTGKVLYRFNTEAPLNGGIVTYSIKGKQYVAVAAGSASAFWGIIPAPSKVVVFALP